MSATITIDSRIFFANLFRKSSFDNPDTSYHFYIGNTLPWENEYSPDISINSTKQIGDHLLYRIFMKKLVYDDTVMAIKRYNWKKWTTYTSAYYDKDFYDYRNWIHPESPFYIMNSEGNVYKCIHNNYNMPSTIEPTGTPSFELIRLTDGYIWKFMFNLYDGSAQNKPFNVIDTFLTDTWIPVPDRDDWKTTAHIAVENSAKKGEIPFIRIDDQGSGYDPATTKVIIKGDGTGAEGSAFIENGQITEIQLVSTGIDYTVATVEIYGNGTGAKATPMIAPIAGHGSDAVRELGATYLELSVSIIEDEDGVAPEMGTYRNCGIVKDTLNILGEKVHDERVSLLSYLNISDASGTFRIGEIVIGEDSEARGLVYFDPGGADKDVTVYVIFGTFQDGERIHGQETGEVGVYNEALSDITIIDNKSGNILYKENILFITRRKIQTEKFIFTIEF
jgi:hypothetical protein